MELLRCPRCWYGLRVVYGYWWCDVCRIYWQPYLPTKPSLGARLRSLEYKLRQGIRRFSMGKPRGPVITPVPLGHVPLTMFCHNCGSPIYGGVANCPRCGISPTSPRIPEAAPGTYIRHARAGSMDDRVYDYIVQRAGTISLSQAAKDLGITLDELSASIASLKKAGRIGDWE